LSSAFLLLTVVGGLACSVEPATSGLLGPVPPMGRRLAVIGSDYAASAVSLFDLDGPQRVGSALWTSGTVVTPSGTLLSGDVVLGQTPLGDGRLVVIDRTHGVVSLFDPSGPAAQWSVATGFYANPQDVIPLPGDATSAGVVIVSRLGRNPKPTPTAEDFDEGDDLLRLDPGTGQVLGRLPLEKWTTLPGAVAGPGRMAFDGQRLWVPLQSVAVDFQSAGPGRLLAVDPSGQTVTAVVELPFGRNCGTVRWLPDLQRLVVLCTGLFADGPAQQLAYSVVAVVDPAAPKPTATVLARAQDLPEPHPFGLDLALTQGGRGVLSVPGDFTSGRVDQLWRIDVGTGKLSAIGQGHAIFRVGGMCGDPATGRVYVADRGRPAGDVRVFRLNDDGSTTEEASLASNPGGLGATDLARF
jgi:hypothetical protein